MKLTAPYSGAYIEAEGEMAKRLIARGFKQVEAPAPKKTKRKKA